MSVLHPTEPLPDSGEVTLARAADYMGMLESTLQKHIDAGAIPALNKNRETLLMVSDVREYNRILETKISNAFKKMLELEEEN